MSKPVLLLLPGLTCDDGVWQGQIDGLSNTHDVRVPNFFGLDSFEAMTAATLAMTDGPFAVAGHSMGGRVAMQVADTAPERVERVALLDTGAHLPASGEAASRQVLVDLGEAQGMDAVIAAWLPPMLAAHRQDDKALWNAIADMQRRAGLQTFKGQVRALLNRKDGFAQLGRLRVPTAFITGDQDSWSSPAQHAEMQAATPGSTLTIINDSGHMAPMEQPEAVNAALRKWLEQEPS